MTAGETATFECELSYEGIPVEWFLGRQKMEASSRVSREPLVYNTSATTHWFKTLVLLHTGLQH